MQTKNIPALIAALFFILSLLLYFGKVPTYDGGLIGHVDSLKLLCDAPDQTSVQEKINGFIIDNAYAKKMTSLYKTNKDTGYQFQYKGIYLSMGMLMKMIELNKCEIPAGVFISFGAEPDETDTNKLNTTYIVSLDTEKYNETSDSYQMMQKPNNEFIHAMINKNTSLCPDRCFKPLDK
jgi:hypothetical protein